MKVAGTSIEEVLRGVRREVEEQTTGQQLPFMESGLLHTIVLKPFAPERRSRSIRDVRQSPTPAPNRVAPKSTERRLAIVIGNANYLHAGPLPNAENDAADVGQALRRLGFDVTEMSDADQQKMRNALSAFDERVEKEAPDWALVYYAGHGIARDESPYMVPVDAKLTSHTVIDQQAVAVMPILGTVSKARRVGVVILDACRENPFLEQMKVGARKRNIIMNKGLPAVEPADENVLVAYATKHGLVASDGEEGRRNSPYVESLLEVIERPGIELDMLFRLVRQSVRRRTNNEQLPYTYASLPPEPIYFAPPRQ